mgnify:CR=1 FL=1
MILPIARRGASGRTTRSSRFPVRTIGLFLAALTGLTTAAEAHETQEISSPDGRIVVSVALQDGDLLPRYSIRQDGREIMRPSAAGFPLTGSPQGWGEATANLTKGRDRYDLPAAKVRSVDEAYNQLELAAGRDGAGNRVKLYVRVYDTGVAIRGIVEAESGNLAQSLQEVTEFMLPREAECHGSNLGRFHTAHEAEFDPVRPDQIRQLNLFDAPFVCAAPDGTGAFAIAEADVHDYPLMMFGGVRTGDSGLAVMLADPPGGLPTPDRGNRMETPWRVVMIADNRGKLIENTLITSLNRPAEGDFAWVKPGKYAWDWWNGQTVRSVEKPGMNMATIKAFIDFAGANGFEYMMIDDGWYLNSGAGGRVLPGADNLTPIAAVEIPELVAYARQQNVDLILWVHSDMIRTNMEQALALYASWGIKGIKVDFMDRDDAEMVEFYNRIAEATARHRILLNMHGAYHPTGLIRTYPNYITQEGVLGAEYNRWSVRINARHNVSLAYTRMLTGPMDYTPGAFRNVPDSEFRMTSKGPMVRFTRGQTLAMYVVYDSPLQSVADSPDAYADKPSGLDFIRLVPTAWDETRFLAGEIDEYVVIARRKGRDWYVGAMTDGKQRTLTIPLTFLDKGRYASTIWQDGSDMTSVDTKTGTADRQQSLQLELAPSGGAVAVLRAQ